MTNRFRIILESISLITVAFIIGSYLVWKDNKDFQQKFLATDLLASANNASRIIIPTIPFIPKAEKTSQISPDGKKSLSMTMTQNSDNTNIYQFTVEDESGSNKKHIYSVAYPVSETLSIPFNAFSPDNQYLFIQKNTDDALVFKSNGENIADNQLFFEIKNIFKEKANSAKIRAITGWASERLIIVNTFNADNTIGPSYWFEVPSKAVIQLSTLFE